LRPGLFRKALAAAVVGWCLAAAAPAHAATVQHVTVKMTEYRFRLSANTIHTGTVIFTIVNKGQIAHDFSIQKLAIVSSLVQAGSKTAIRVRFKKPGTYYYLCTVGAHVQYGMFGNLHVRR